MNVTEQLKSKTEALRSVQQYINELIKLRGTHSEDELKEVLKYTECMINSYKQLAGVLRKTNG